MKIYFSGSISGKKLYLSNYKAIVAVLTQQGHEVISDYLFKTNDEDIENQSSEEHIKIHQSLAKWKIESDLVIAELSYRSFGQGQEIAHAFRVGKPVFGLYLQDKKPHLILNDAADRLFLAEYTMGELDQILSHGIEYLAPGSEKRFTMIFPAHIVNHLDGVSRDLHISRSEYIRSLIEKDMKDMKDIK